MEGRYSIEVIEMQCAAECDGNAQVTTPVEIEEEIPATVEDIKVEQSKEREMEKEFYPQDQTAYTMRDGIVYVRTTDAATHWLLVAILCMIFLFMIFRCE